MKSLKIRGKNYRAMEKYPFCIELRNKQSKYQTRKLIKQAKNKYYLDLFNKTDNNSRKQRN